MASIVELREMSDDKLEELLEKAREDQFFLRFQKASARLENYARLKQVRREIAQLETVLRMRGLATDAAVTEPAIAEALSDVKGWQANARFVYEDSAWQVNFVDSEGDEVASAMVNLNQKQASSRRKRGLIEAASPVMSYEIAG